MASPSSKCSFGCAKLRGVAEAALLDVAVLVLADRHVRRSACSGSRRGASSSAAFGLPLRRLELRHVILQPRDLGHQRLRARLVLPRLRLPDLLRERVPPLLRRLQRGDGGAARLVERDQLARHAARARASARPSSNASGFSRMKRMSCMAGAYLRCHSGAERSEEPGTHEHRAERVGPPRVDGLGFALRERPG